MRRFLTYIFLSTFFFSAAVADDFTPAEQQQISIETPGLFSRSSAFQIDFAALKANEYSFPLPVGKVVAVTTSDVEVVTKKGDAVKAMFDGTVRYSRNHHTFGNVIVVRHPNGLETVYGYNAQNLVNVGDKVKAGQTIAIVGNTSPSTKGTADYGLLFSIMVNGRRINPETILDTKSHALRRQTVTIKKVGNSLDITTSRYAKAKDNASANGGAAGSAASGSEGAGGMDLASNDPFGGKDVYRLDLTKIKAWHYPLEGSHVISGYAGARRNHTGVDIKNGPKTNIFACFDGVVVQSGVFSGYGNCITIRHAIGIETRYSHNFKNFVKVGDKVKAGDIIGLTGRTGRATTEHVHFETRINGRPFDPAYIFDHQNHALHQCVLQFKKNGSVTRLK